MFPSNPLEEALAALRQGRISGEALLAAIGEAQLWIPGAPGEDGSVQLPVTEVEGQPLVVAYSSEEQLKAGVGDVPYFVLATPDLVGDLPAHLGLALNMNAEHGLPVNPSGVAQIRGSAHTVQGGSQVYLGEPAERPDGFQLVLGQAFTLMPEVRTARCGLMSVDGNQPTLLIGIESAPVDDARRREIADLVGAVAGRTPLDFPVDVVFVQAGEQVSDFLVAKVEPFYMAA